MQDANDFTSLKLLKYNRNFSKNEIREHFFGKTIRIVHSIHAALLFTTSTLTILRALQTVPSAVPIIGTASGLGGLCLIASQLSRMLSLRLEKRENIRILAESKLGSKALDDNTVSMDEYSLILGELEKFKTMKETKQKAERN